MKLGITKAAMPQQEQVEINVEGLDNLIHEMDMLTVSEAVVTETNENIDSLCAVITKFGFTESLDSLYGVELRDAGITTSADTEELVTSLQALMVAEEGLNEQNITMDLSPGGKGNLVVESKSLLKKIKSLFSKVKAYFSKSAKSVKFTSSTDARLASFMGKSKSAKGPLAIAMFIAGVSVLVFIKLRSNKFLSALLSKDLIIPEDANWDEDVVAKELELASAADSKKALLAANAAFTKLSSLKGADINLDDMDKLLATVEVPDVSLRSIGNAGFNAVAMKDMHKLIIATHKLVLDSIDAMDSVMLEDTDADVDKMALKTFNMTTRESLAIIKFVTVQHVKLVRRSKETMKANA